MTRKRILKAVLPLWTSFLYPTRQSNWSDDKYTLETSSSTIASSNTELNISTKTKIRAFPVASQGMRDIEEVNKRSKGSNWREENDVVVGSDEASLSSRRATSRPLIGRKVLLDPHWSRGCRRNLQKWQATWSFFAPKCCLSVQGTRMHEHSRLLWTDEENLIILCPQQIYAANPHLNNT